MNGRKCRVLQGLAPARLTLRLTPEVVPWPAVLVVLLLSATAIAHAQPPAPKDAFVRPRGHGDAAGTGRVVNALAYRRTASSWPSPARGHHRVWNVRDRR